MNPLSALATEFVPGANAHRTEFPSDYVDPEAQYMKAFELFEHFSVVQFNVSTLHPRELAKSATKQWCGSTMRMLVLDKLFAEKATHVIFVQEGRLQGDGQRSMPTYKAYMAGASPCGGHGSQIWLKHNLTQFVTSVLVLSPRYIRVTLVICSISLQLVSAHAPIEAATDAEKAAFWTLVRGDLLPFRSDPSSVVLFGIDANDVLAAYLVLLLELSVLTSKMAMIRICDPSCMSLL